MQKSVLVIGSGEIGKNIFYHYDRFQKIKNCKINSRDLKDYFKTKEKIF